MSLKVSSAVISAALLLSNAACTQKRDVVPDVVKDGPSAPRIPVNIDKAAGFKNKDTEIDTQKKSKGSDNSGSTPQQSSVHPVGAKPAAAMSPSGNGATEKQPFAWNIPVVAAKSARISINGLERMNERPAAKEEAPAPTETKPTIDYSSEAIKREAFAKISFESPEELVDLMKNPDAVIYKGQVASEKLMAGKIKTLNEESYCKVSFQGEVRKSDFFRLDIESLSTTPIDTENVVNIFKATYKNSSGEILLTCTHTTSNFFMQAAQIDLAKWITFYEFSGNKIETQGYKNPLTEARKVEAVRIKDPEKFKKVILDESSKDTFALLKGEIVDMAEGFGAVANKKDTQSCIINDVAGVVTKDLVYVRVAKGILEPTPPENPNANMYVTYRADAENFFIMSCIMAKSESWTKLMDTTQGVLEFGALDRVPLLKKGPELQKIQSAYEASLRN